MLRGPSTIITETQYADVRYEASEQCTTDHARYMPGTKRALKRCAPMGRYTYSLNVNMPMDLARGTYSSVHVLISACLAPSETQGPRAPSEAGALRSGQFALYRAPYVIGSDRTMYIYIYIYIYVYTHTYNVYIYIYIYIYVCYTYRETVDEPQLGCSQHGPCQPFSVLIILITHIYIYIYIYMYNHNNTNNTTGKWRGWPPQHMGRGRGAQTRVQRKGAQGGSETWGSGHETTPKSRLNRFNRRGGYFVYLPRHC